MRRARPIVTTLGLAVLLGGLVGCSMFESEPTLVERAEVKEEKLAELKREADRTARLEAAKREAEMIRASLADEVERLETELETLRREIEQLEKVETEAKVRAMETGAAEDVAAAKQRETERLEHKRRIEQYEREIASLKQLLRQSAETD